MVTNHGWGYALGNAFLIAAIAALLVGGPSIWIVAVIILAVGAPVDESVGDTDNHISESHVLFFQANVYATLPLLALATLALWRIVALTFHTGIIAVIPQVFPAMGSGGYADVGVAVFLVGYCYAVFGATVGHELTHRTGVLAAYVSARGLFALTFNTGFTIFHVHGHHRQVATFADPATARRGEYILAFVARTIAAQFLSALKFEAARERQRGHMPFGLSNRAVSGQLYSLGILIIAAVIAGVPGVIASVIAGLVGRFFHELVNYVQHFGLVRVEGSPVGPRHTWDCHRLLSNLLHYNLPMHADHHMFAGKPFWKLDRVANAPVLPHGYQTMVVVAFVPSLWQRTMGPLLAAWDSQAANDEERALIRQRGWEGRC